MSSFRLRGVVLSVETLLILGIVVVAVAIATVFLTTWLAKLVASPKAVVSIGAKVYSLTSVSAYVDVTVANMGNVPVTVTAVTLSSPGAYTCSKTVSVKVEPGVTTTFSVAITDDDCVGSFLIVPGDNVTVGIRYEYSGGIGSTGVVVTVRAPS